MFFKKRAAHSAVPAAVPVNDANGNIATAAALEAAIVAVQTLLRTHREVQIAYDAAIVGLRQAQQEFTDSTDRLARVEAASALGGETDRAARKAHLAARDALEFADARVRGMKSRLDESIVSVTEARDALRREWCDWQSRREQALIEMYEKALGRFLDAIQEVLAGATAMAHSNRLRSIVRGLYLPDPSNAFANLANPSRLKKWETVPAARDLHDKLGAVAARVLPLIADDAVAATPVSPMEQTDDAA